jgi:hypothetical protein
MQILAGVVTLRFLATSIWAWVPPVTQPEGTGISFPQCEAHNSPPSRIGRDLEGSGYGLI